MPFRRLIIVALAIAAAVIADCAPLPAPPSSRQLTMHYDSVRDSVARANGPAWRALHYPAADLHGPFPRPALGDTAADANDPIAYYRLGDSVRGVLPGLADRAYYWATRLDPTFANAYLARWRLLHDDDPWREMPDGSLDRASALPQSIAAATDSLLETAITYSPFLDGTLDVPRYAMYLDKKMVTRDPIIAGARSYDLGDFRAAAKDWGEGLRRKPYALMLHVARAYAWVKLGENDSAIADLSALAQRLDQIQRDSAFGPYVSKASIYYAIGMLHAGKHRMAEARTAYQQALAEDLGFYMAHMRLAGAAAQLGDTTTALSEVQMALLIRGDDPLLLVYSGTLLLRTGRVADAEQQFRAALRVDSVWALPYAMLGLSEDTRNDTAAALADYRDCLAHATRRATERDWVMQRVTALTPRPAPRLR